MKYLLLLLTTLVLITGCERTEEKSFDQAAHLFGEREKEHELAHILIQHARFKLSLGQFAAARRLVRRAKDSMDPAGARIRCYVPLLLYHGDKEGGDVEISITSERMHHPRLDDELLANTQFNFAVL